MPNHLRHFAKRSLNVACFVLFLSASTAFAQTSTFTYQGRLTDGGTPANGTYDLQFKLYDALTNGNLQGSPNTVTKTGVNVASGIFTVQLDFGAGAFPGADRFLEISVKHPLDSSYTTLSPRQQLTSSPYAIQTLNAAQLGGVAASQYVKTNDSRLTDARTPTGTAGGSLSGTYPNPTLATGTINSTSLFSSSLLDGAAGTATLRSLGTGATQAAAGNDSRLTNARTPTGSAGGSLSGTYPNPTLGTGVVGTSNLAALPNVRTIQTVAQTFADDGAFHRVALDTTVFSSNVTFDNANDQLVIQTAGVYLVTGEIVWAENSSGVRFLTLNVNVSTEVNADGRNAIAGTNTVQNVFTIVRLNAGDRINMTAAQTSGGNLNTDPSFGRGAALSAVWLSP